MAYLGNQPVVGDSTNSFKTLDDIASFTVTFDATSSDVVSIANDTLTFNNHRFVTGQKVTYTDGGGTAIGGLTDGTSYFIIKVDQNTIKLATNASNAASSTAINLTSGAAGGSHTLNIAFDGVNTKFKATHSNGTKASVSRAAQLSLSINGVVQQPQDTSSPTVGYGVEADSTIVFSTAPQNGDKAFGSFIGETAPSFDITDNTVDNFTGDGSTTLFSLSKEVPSSQDVLVTIDGVTQYPSDASTTRSYSIVGQSLIFVSAPADGTAIQARHIGFAGASTSAVTGFYGRTGNAALISTDDISVQNISGVGATFTGNVNIGGVLTYEDVTNVDSVGLITAREGVFIPDSKKLQLGNAAGSADLQIFHNTSDSVISQSGSGTGNLKILSGGAQSIECVKAGAVIIAHNGNTKLTTTATGVEVTGNLSAANVNFTGELTVAETIGHTGDTHTKLSFPANDTIALTTGGTERARIDNGGNMQVSAGQFTVGTTATTGLQFINDGTFGTLHSADLTFRTVSATRMTLDTNGYLGIGTVSPTGVMTIVAGGNHLHFDRSGFDKLSFGTGTVNGLNGLHLSNIKDGTTPISIDENAAAAAVRLNSAGDLGLNVAPSAKLDVVDDSASGYIAEFRQGNTSNSAQIVIDSPEDNDGRPVLIDMQRAGSTKWSIGQGYNSSGGAFHLATSSLSAGVTGVKASFLTGGGLTFNGDTAAANALDDYEEGSWTATFVPASGSYGSLYTSGHYTKIGDVVHLTASISINGETNASGEVQISGLPFSVRSINSTWSGEGGHGVGRWFYAGPNHYCFLVCDNGTDRIRVHKADGTFLNHSNMSTGYNQSQFSFTVTYLSD